MRDLKWRGVTQFRLMINEQRINEFVLIPKVHLRNAVPEAPASREI